MPGIVSDSFFSIQMWDNFFSLFLITSARLPCFADGPRVRLELGNEYTSVLKGCGFVHVCVCARAPTHVYHPSPGSLTLPLKNSQSVFVREYVCTKGDSNHLL